MQLDDLIQQVRFEEQCKVCQLSTLHEKAFRDIHSLYFQRGLSLRRIADMVNPILEAEKVQIRPLNKTNLTNHLRGSKKRKAHIPVEAHVTAEVVRTVRHPISAAREEAAGDVQREVQRDAVMDQINLYKAGVTLYRDLEGMQKTLRKKVAEAKTADVPLEGKTLAAYLAVIRELRGILGELNRIQSVEKLLTAVTGIVVKELTFDFLNALGTKIDRMGFDEKIRMNLRQAIGNTLADHAKAAILKVKEGNVVLN